MPGGAQANPIFVHKDTGTPVPIYLDMSLSLQIRREWTKKIRENGGTVVRDSSEAEYVIFSKKRDKATEQSGFAASTVAAKRKVTVHYVDFLEACWDAGTIVVFKDKVKGMSGRKHGRVSFTDEDVDNLCRYIAAVVPEVESGGRRGSVIYKRLVNLGKTNPEYAWAQRHTWQAWRNKYNKNFASFNEKIEAWIPEINPNRIRRHDADRRMNDTGYEESSEESEDDTDDEEDDPDKTEDNDDDDTQPGPSDKGKRRAPPEDEDEEEEQEQEEQEEEEQEDDRRSQRDENGGETNNKTPPPGHRHGEDATDSWEAVDEVDFQAPEDLNEPPADSAPTPRSEERHARFASNAGPQPIPIQKPRRLSLEQPAPAKRPRISVESASSTASQRLRVARLPAGVVPGGKADSDPEDDEGEDEDEDRSDSEAMDVAHSLFSDDDAQLEQDEDLDDILQALTGGGVLSGLSDARPPTIPSATSSTVFPISTDRTLVMTASPRKATGDSPRKLAQLSSASRKEQHIVLDQPQEPEAKALDIIVVEDDDDDEMLGEGNAEQDQDMEEEAGEPASGRRSPSVEIVPHQPSPKVVEAPAPAAQASRNRRRKAERQAQPVPAPARMTRSRSQSVEPTEFASLPQKPSKRKRKAKVFEPEPEIMEEEEAMEEVIEEQPQVPEQITGKETLADEEDVMNIITNEDDFSHLSNATSAAQQEVVTGSSKTISRPPSPAGPSSDDEQVLRRIAAQHVQLEGAVVKKRPRKSQALVEAFKMGMAATQNTPAARLPLPSQLLVNPARSISALQRASEKKRTPRPVPYKGPNTPTRVPKGDTAQPSSQKRAVSTASSSNETVESIPMPGTRAKAFKAKIEEEEKYTTYTPPRGTRASLYTQDRQTARSSRRR